MSRVLVVDDDDDIRHLVVELLRLHDFETIPASSGVEALELLASPAVRTPDLVMLDVQMPEMDGWDTLRRIRQRPELTGVGVILCTVKASDTDIELGRVLGCDAYVAKPFGIAELVVTIESVLARRRTSVDH